MYVRYISHELRTPLNSAYLGKDDTIRQKINSWSNMPHSSNQYDWIDLHSITKLPSHPIPMTAGLKLVSDDLMSSNSDKDSDHCETLLDVQSACRTAVEILNDLLCFDKLESGILEVHKHDVPVIPFIADCVNMFASQAREAGVTIQNITNHVELLPEMEVNIDILAPPSAIIETDLLNEADIQCCQVHPEGRICDCVRFLHS
jgi:signal transduction histidine kinase